MERHYNEMTIGNLVNLPGMKQNPGHHRDYPGRSQSTRPGQDHVALERGKEKILNKETEWKLTHQIGRVAHLRATQFLQSQGPPRQQEKQLLDHNPAAGTPRQQFDRSKR